MIAWTINSAIESKNLIWFSVSTDCEEIAQIAIGWCRNSILKEKV